MKSSRKNQENRASEGIHGLYIRVSTEAQAEEGFSITAQTERLEAYATAMGWKKTKIFVDGGFSGSNLDRPAIAELISRVKEGEIASVVVYKLDRLSRSQKDTLFLIEDVFLPNNVDFISLNESIDTSTPYGRAMIGILSAFAQLERENIYLRTRMGMLERVKQGYWMGGGTTPFGYDYDKEQGILIENQEEARKVRQVFSLYLQGKSPQKIAELLGLRYDRLVMQIINRRSNLGLISYKGKEYVGRHVPLISEEIYERAQEKRRSRQVSVRKEGTHLLSGLIFCKECGSRLRYVKWGKAGYKLRCYSQDPSKTYMTGGRKCTAPSVWAEEVETIILGDIQGISADLGDEKREFLTFDGEIEKGIVKLKGKLKRLYHLYGQAEDDDLLEAISECKESLEALIKTEKEEKKQLKRRNELSHLRHRISLLGESWCFLTLPQRQEILRECIEKIEILGDNMVIHYVFMTEDREVAENSTVDII